MTSRRPLAVAFVFGIVFALGLGLSGMTQPARVVGFLDVAGAFDPTLLLVMGSAVAVSFLAFPWILARPRPLLAATFEEAKRWPINKRLLFGAVLFGIGWGLAGYCPGPAIVSLATGSVAVWTFVGAMVAGLYLGGSASRALDLRQQRAAGAHDAQAQTLPGRHRPGEHPHRAAPL